LYIWLESPADCPADALGFDFDGATFSHAGIRVTFEILLRAPWQACGKASPTAINA